MNFYLFGGYDSPALAVGGVQGTEGTIKRTTAGRNRRSHVSGIPSTTVVYMDTLDIRKSSAIGGFYFGVNNH